MKTTVDREIEVNQENQWRLETPGEQGWARTARPGASGKRKYFMVSCDTHLSPPPKLFAERIDKRFLPLLPRVEKRKDGSRWMVQHGLRPERLVEPTLQGEDLLRTKVGAGLSTIEEACTIEQRVRDQDLDGVDAEVIFPNGPALLMWAGEDPAFILAQCRIWNDWVIDYCRPFLSRCSPAAAIPTASVDDAIAEVKRAAELGFRVLTLPTKPIWGAESVDHPNYNLPLYDPLWEVIQDLGLPVTFHISSGKDPRAARGNGGAIMNYVVHALAPTIEPVVAICSSGVCERFPRLRFATIEANAGWVPWLMDMMDEAYLKHHFWVRPKLKELPSTYYRERWGASLTEDRSALLLAEPYGLENNLMWANDFPHHEGTWPHSAEAIERSFGRMREETRANLLGLNAARLFGFEVTN